MRSLGARLVLWYSVVSTSRWPPSSRSGFYLLNRHLVHSLDLLNAVEFESVKSGLGPALAALTADELDNRMQSMENVAAPSFISKSARPTGGSSLALEISTTSGSPRVRLVPTSSTSSSRESESSVSVAFRLEGARWWWQHRRRRLTRSWTATRRSASCWWR